MIVLHHETAPSFNQITLMLGRYLLRAPEVKVPEWQSLDVADKPMGITHELENVTLEIPIPEHRDVAAFETKCNEPWAEKHFLERVSGFPLNPPPSANEWPFTREKHEDHTENNIFSHTYPERFWPKHANRYPKDRPIGGIKGIRFSYGDLTDVVNQLRRSPMTRQAFLPVWFPEDTGAVHGERVPCSLGYQFLIRQGRLNVTYFIRSCDFLRHFPDDVYMAMRLGQWMRSRLEEGKYSEVCSYEMGTLMMHITSLHIFGGDMPMMEKKYGSKT